MLGIRGVLACFCTQRWCLHAISCLKEVSVLSRTIVVLLHRRAQEEEMAAVEKS